MPFLDCISEIGSNSGLKQAYSAFSEGSFVSSLDLFGTIGSPEAVYCTAFHYLNGKGVKRDVKKAFELFVKSMDAGYVPAIAEVAQCYGYGIGIKCNDGKAFELFMKSAEAGDPYGMSMVSMMYRNGDGIKRNAKLAEEWADRCEESGDLDALDECGLQYLVSGNVILGRLYLMRSAVIGSPVAAKALELIYSFGDGVAQDDDEAVDWADTAETNGWDEVTLGDLDGYESWFKKYIDLGELAEEDE